MERANNIESMTYPNSNIYEENHDVVYFGNSPNHNFENAHYADHFSHNPYEPIASTSRNESLNHMSSSTEESTIPLMINYPNNINCSRLSYQHPQHYEEVTSTIQPSTSTGHYNQQQQFPYHHLLTTGWSYYNSVDHHNPYSYQNEDYKQYIEMINRFRLPFTFYSSESDTSDSDLTDALENLDLEDSDAFEDERTFGFKAIGCLNMWGLCNEYEEVCSKHPRL